MIDRLLMTALAGVVAGCSALPPLATASVPLERQALPNPDAQATVYTNGRWYAAGPDGPSFVSGERYAVNGIFVATRPADATIVDLGGAYVVPPFGEAHNHNLDGPWTAERGKSYLRRGVFYMKNTNSVVSVDRWAAKAWESVDTVDIAWAHAGISIDEGHPEKLYRRIANVYRLDPEKLEGDVFWAAPDIATLEAKWPDVLATDPDLIKLYLMDVEDEFPGASPGLPQDVFVRAVELAQAADLPVTVHVDTARDWLIAMRAGANEAAHMPPQFVRSEETADRFVITEAMAQEAAARGFTTVTTTLIARNYLDEGDEQLALIREVQAGNIARLVAAGAPVVFGSDQYDKDGLAEAAYVLGLGVLTDAEVLRLAVETAPRSIFPRRAIGTLAPGYEASFVALRCDPAADFAACTQDPRLLVKQGRDLMPALSEPPAQE